MERAARKFKKILSSWITKSRGPLSFGHTHSIVDPKLIFSIRFTKPLYWWEKGGRDCGGLRRFGESDTKDQVRINNRVCVAEALRINLGILLFEPTSHTRTIVFLAAHKSCACLHCTLSHRVSSSTLFITRKHGPLSFLDFGPECRIWEFLRPSTSTTLLTQIRDMVQKNNTVRKQH